MDGNLTWAMSRKEVGWTRDGPVRARNESRRRERRRIALRFKQALGFICDQRKLAFRLYPNRSPRDKRFFKSKLLNSRRREGVHAQAKDFPRKKEFRAVFEINRLFLHSPSTY
jgi:hypothetical protein